MLRRMIGLLSITTLALLHCPARAAIIKTSMVIDANNSFPGETVEVVDGANPPTVVDVVEGGVIGGKGVVPDIVTRGQSIVRLWNGGILESDYDAVIDLYDQSHMRVAGEYGYWQELNFRLHNSAQIDLVAGSTIGGVQADGTSVIRSNGARLDRLILRDNARAYLADTAALGILRLDAHDRSILRITGGVHEGVVARGDSIVWYHSSFAQDTIGVTDRAQFHLLDVFFGHAADIIGAYGDATFHVYGTDLKIEYVEFELPAITGISRSGKRLYQPFILEDNARIVFHTVPEPTSATAFALGALAIAASRRRFASR